MQPWWRNNIVYIRAFSAEDFETFFLAAELEFIRGYENLAQYEIEKNAITWSYCSDLS